MKNDDCGLRKARYIVKAALRHKPRSSRSRAAKTFWKNIYKWHKKEGDSND